MLSPVECQYDFTCDACGKRVVEPMRPTARWKKREPGKLSLYCDDCVETWLDDVKGKAMALSAKAFGAPARENSGGGDFGKMLRGQDVKGKIGTEIKVKCTGVRQAPEDWSSPVIMDISGYEDFSSVCLNKTNISILAAKVGDDIEKAVGKHFTLKTRSTRTGVGFIFV